jgi:hypothetical protein
MAAFRSLASRFSALFRRRELDHRLDEELEFHTGMQTEENIRRGMALPDARAAARRTLGNTTQVREDVYGMNTISFLEETAGNVQVSLRTLGRNPGFALTAVLVLALGLGASTAMFSALDGILFRPLPYGDVDRLVNVGMTFPSVEHPDHSDVLLVSRSYRVFWKPAPEPFIAMTTFGGMGNTCDVTEQRPERLRCTTVESNFLQTFGVRPTLGRDFTPKTTCAARCPVAIISHDIWTRRFGADPGAIGQTIDLNGKRTPVIGVLPVGFAVPDGQADILQPQHQLGNFDGVLLRVFGRLKAGFTPEQAETAIAPLIDATAKRFGTASLPGLGSCRCGTISSATPRARPGCCWEQWPACS